jgi:GcrA cell cycle regulator
MSTPNRFHKPTDAEFAQARREDGWTTIRTAVMKWCWGEGLSASQIAKQLTGVSRSAVVGKMHRLGLTGSTTSIRGAASAPRSMASPPVPRRLSVAGNNMVFETVGNERPPREIVPNRVEDAGSATVLTLGAHMCKWPIGGPAREGFTFCGRRQDPGRVYCAEHAKVAYQQPQQNPKAVRNLSGPSVGRGRSFNTVSR